MKKLNLLLLLSLFILNMSSYAQSNLADKAKEDLAYSIGVQAYIWGFAPMEVNRTVKFMTNVEAPRFPGFAPINQFTHASKLADHTFTAVPRANNDTYYSTAWLDLSDEPMILTIPDMGERFYVFQLIDAYSNNFNYVGSRARGGKGRKIALCNKGWSGKLPADIERIDAPTPIMYVLGRTLVEGKEDSPNVIALQNQMTLIPFSKYGSDYVAPKGKVIEHKKYEGDLAFFAELGDIITKNKPLAQDISLLKTFEIIGLSPVYGFDASKLDEPAKKGLIRAIEDGDNIIKRYAETLGRNINGWTLTPADDNLFGTDYLYRATIAYAWLYLNDASDAYYPTAYLDENGNNLDGSKGNFILHFEKDNLPPANAFWSATMYKFSNNLLAENTIGRYSIGDRTKGLKYNKDGSLTLYIQHESPGKGKEGNWLPAPNEQFVIGMRLYNPDVKVKTGEWIPPTIKVE